MQAEVVVDSIAFGEGRYLVPDQTLVVSERRRNALYRVWPGEGRAGRIADCRRRHRNGAALASDGWVRE